MAKALFEQATYISICMPLDKKLLCLVDVTRNLRVHVYVYDDIRMLAVSSSD